MKEIALDFDGVLHSYPTGWHGAAVIDGEPIPGALEFVQGLLQAGITIHIFSARNFQPGGIQAMKRWFEDNKFPVNKFYFPTEKPGGWLLDDHAIEFRGTFPDIEVLKTLKTWQKKG